MLFAMLGASVTASGETLHKLVINPSTAHAAVKPQVPVKKSAIAASQSRAEDEEWTYVGTGKYTDDILTNAGVPSATWEVEIYESASAPGFYRVENPFGNGNCPQFQEKFESCDFLLHAENPDAVWMEYVELKNIDFGLLGVNIAPLSSAIWRDITLAKVILTLRRLSAWVCAPVRCRVATSLLKSKDL